MSYSRTLITAASGVIAGLGAQKIYLYQLLPAPCVSAIEQNLSDQIIAQACPPGFNNLGILLLLGVAIVIFLFVNNLFDPIASGAKALFEPNKS